jgi:hypothetical protein
MSESRMDYLTDVEKKQFEDKELLCKHNVTSEAGELHKEAATKFLLDVSQLYTEIRIRASLEEMTVEERAYLGEKELPHTTIVLICGLLAKFLRYVVSHHSTMISFLKPSVLSIFSGLSTCIHLQISGMHQLLVTHFTHSGNARAGSWHDAIARTPNC